jgi:hypothetical protein
MALLAQDGLVDQIFSPVLDAQGGQSGIEASEEPFGAYQLADFAPGAEIEVSDQAQTFR